MKISLTGAISILLILVPAWFTWAFLGGKKLPLISNERGAFIGLAAIGFVMCCLTFPMKSAQAGFNWLSPFTIAAILLGALIGVLIPLVLTGRAAPLIPDTRAALIALGILILAKWAVATLHTLIKI